METFRLTALPSELEWRNRPLDWRVEDSHRLMIAAGKETDLFVDPAKPNPQDNAPCALFSPPDACFLLSAKVQVAFASRFDAGVLQLRQRDDLWAKLCFEFSPERQPMIVSVVTRGVSDDCNSAVIDKAEIYLRIAQTPTTTAFHYSHDGQYWHFVRYFSLGAAERIQVGFSAQSPTGAKCAAVFSEIRYQPGLLKNNRSGE